MAMVVAVAVAMAMAVAMPVAMAVAVAVAMAVAMAVTVSECSVVWCEMERERCAGGETWHVPVEVVY